MHLIFKFYSEGLYNVQYDPLSHCCHRSFHKLTASSAWAETKTFVYSGGCFWCSEADSEKLDGVSEVISGFTAGTTPSPRYYSGEYGDHREAAQVFYDPAVISFEDLVRHVYRTVDYEDNKGQFCDRGHSYSPAIYYKNEMEKEIAERLAPQAQYCPWKWKASSFLSAKLIRISTKRTRQNINSIAIGGRDQRVKELNGE